MIHKVILPVDFYYRFFDYLLEFLFLIIVCNKKNPQHQRANLVNQSQLFP